MFRFWQSTCLAAFAALTLTACGDDSLGDRVNISLDPLEQTAALEVEMSDGLQVNLNGEFDIADGYGTLRFEPATRVDNAKIVVEFDVAQAINDQLDGYALVTELPNNSPLPVAMTPPLIGIPVLDNGDISVKAAASILPELQVGALIGISQFQTRYFPQGVSICQNFRNEEGYAFAAVCLYGPGSNESGGIFVGGNFGQVLDMDLFQPGMGEALASTDLGQSRSSLALVSAASQVQPVAMSRAAVMQSSSEESWAWTEERYDPRRKLRGRKGLKALRNAKRILRAR